MKKFLGFSALLILLYSCSEQNPPPNEPIPSASFYFSYVGYDTVSVTFDNTSTDATSYAWDFGDGGTSTLEDPTHIFNGAGSYNVKLTASNQYGSDTVINVVTVLPTPTHMLINQIAVTSFSAGVGAWDDQIPFSDPYGYPDLIAYVESFTGLNYVTCIGATHVKLNASMSGAPYYFDPSPAGDVTNFSDTLKVKLYDDDTFDSDDLMGTVSFTMNDYVGTYPASITATSGSITVTLGISWQ